MEKYYILWFERIQLFLKFSIKPINLKNAINQLLTRYISWRDTKTAILLINKNRKISTILKKFKSIVEDHDLYKEEKILSNKMLKKEGVFSYIFKHPSDKEIEIIITFLIFDISIN